MPVMYSSIVQEHVATRTAAGLFDISHMGRIRLDGENADKYLDGLLTRRVLGLPSGGVRYSLVTNDDGGILDDVLVYRLRNGAETDYHILVVNAGNREKIFAWIQERLDFGVSLSDVSQAWSMIAIQGPKALELAQPLVEAPLGTLGYYTATETRIRGHGGIVSRTGYTGEDGCEVIVGSQMVETIWEELAERAVKVGGLPAGLGCRDTLRLEAGMPLYGHELTEKIDPYQAGLGFAVQLEGRSFPGSDVLQSRKNDKTRQVRVGLELVGKRVPREGYKIIQGGRGIGSVTSGTFSPTLQRPIAMGYVDPEYGTPGTRVELDIRGRREPASITKLPFYKREQPKGPGK